MDDIAIRISEAVEELENGTSIEDILNGQCCKSDEGAATEDLIRKIIYRYLVQEEIAGTRDAQEESYHQRFPRFQGITAAIFKAASSDDVQSLSEFREFVVISRLGTGGQGSAYCAYSIKMEREVAIKVLEGGDAKRFLAEAQNHGRLVHQNIVRVYDQRSLRSGKQLFILMDYVEGPNLSEYLKRDNVGGKMPPMEAARVIRVVANALDHAHKRLVIHRDVKPSNVLIEEVGVGSDGLVDPHLHVRLADFGIAKRIDSETTKTGGFHGTPAYMSPEQVNEEEPTTLIDVYALGAVLYTLTVGTPPFPKKTVAEILAAVISEAPRFPQSLPRNLRTICETCLSKEPAKRYQSASEVADELERFISGHPIKARHASRIERILLWCRRKPATAAALALAVSLVVAIPILSSRLQLAELRASEETARADLEATRVAAKNKELRFEESLKEQEKYTRLLSETERFIAEQPRGWTVDGLARLQQAAQLKFAEGDAERIRSLSAACISGVDVIETDDEDVPTRVTTNVEFAGLKVPFSDFHPKFVAFSNDRKHFFVANHKGVACCIVRFDAETRKEESQLLVPSNFAATFRSGAWNAIFGGAIRELKENESSSKRIQKLDVMEVSPTDDWLAAGLRSGVVCMWDLQAKEPKSIDLKFHEKGVVASTFAPDGKSLYTASSDGVLVKWVLSDGAWEREQVTRMVVHDLCFSNGELLASVDDGIQKVDAESLAVIDDKFVKDVFGQLRLHASPNGHVLAAAFANKIWLIDARSGEIIRSLSDPALINQAHDEAVSSVNISRNGDLLASSDGRNRTKLWDVGSGRLLTTIHHASQHEGQAVFSPDDGELMVISRHHAIIYTILGIKEGVVARQVVSATPIRAFDISEDRLVTLSGHQSVVATAEGINDRRRIAETRVDGHLTWDLTPVNSISLGASQEVAYFTSPENKGLFAWDIDEDAIRQRIPLQKPLGVVASPTANQLWVIDDKDLVHFNIRGDGTVNETSRWTNEVFAAVFDGRTSVYSISATGEHAICGTRDGRIRVFTSGADVVSGFKALDGEEVHSVALSGSKIALAGLWNGRVLVYELETRKTSSIEAHTASVASIACSPSGMVATASLDGHVALWEVTEAKTLKRMWGMRFSPLPPSSVRFSPDGNRLGILLRNDHCVRVFDLRRLNNRFDEILRQE